MIDPFRLNQDVEALWERRRQAALSRYANRQAVVQLDEKLTLSLRKRPQPEPSSPWLVLVHDLWQDPPADQLFDHYRATPDLAFDWLAWAPIRSCFTALKELWHSQVPEQQALVLRLLARQGEEPVNLDLQSLCHNPVSPAIYSATLSYVVRLRQDWAKEWLATRLDAADTEAAAAWLALSGPLTETASIDEQTRYTMAQQLLASADANWLKTPPYDALRLLLLSGSDRQVTLWINQFSRQDQALAILAMGLSGRSRYLHWLAQVEATDANRPYLDDAIHLLTGLVPETTDDDFIAHLDEGFGSERLLGGQSLLDEQIGDPDNLSQRNRYQWAWHRYWHRQTRLFDDPRRSTVRTVRIAS